MSKKPVDDLVDPKVNVKILLAVLWAATLFMFIYVDIISFYKPGVISDILEGKVWEFDVSQSWALSALILMVMPCLMVLLSLFLPAKINRRTNLVVGSIYILVSLGNPLGETWVYMYFGAFFEVVFLTVIIWHAWHWPRRDPNRIG